MSSAMGSRLLRHVTGYDSSVIVISLLSSGSSLLSRMSSWAIYDAVWSSVETAVSSSQRADILAWSEISG